MQSTSVNSTEITNTLIFKKDHMVLGVTGTNEFNKNELNTGKGNDSIMLDPRGKGQQNVSMTLIPKPTED